MTDILIEILAPSVHATTVFKPEIVQVAILGQKGRYSYIF